MNRLALIAARSQAADAVLGFSVIVAHVREERPENARQLVERSRSEALDRLATLGTCLALARLDISPLEHLAEDVALGLLGVVELDQGVEAIRQIRIP